MEIHRFQVDIGGFSGDLGHFQGIHGLHRLPFEHGVSKAFRGVSLVFPGASGGFIGYLG